MVKFAADENLNANIVRGLLRRNPQVDVVRAQDVGLSGADDPTVLQWCATEGRILLTRDVTTITKYAYERIVAGQAMPGVLEISRGIALSVVIDDLVLISECSEAKEWDGQIRYLPLR